MRGAGTVGAGRFAGAEADHGAFVGKNPRGSCGPRCAGLACAFFGPVLLDGWREASQHEYTAKAAYWRAREVVRNHSVPSGSLVNFSRFSQSKVELQPRAGATVALRGELIDARGTAQPMVWYVDMTFDEQRAEWSGAPAAEPAPK